MGAPCANTMLARWAWKGVVCLDAGLHGRTPPHPKLQRRCPHDGWKGVTYALKQFGRYSYACFKHRGGWVGGGHSTPKKRIICVDASLHGQKSGRGSRPLFPTQAWHDGLAPDSYGYFHMSFCRSLLIHVFLCCCRFLFPCVLTRN